MTKEKEELISVTINLKPQTVERLEKICQYLNFRRKKDHSLEYIIKASIADYLTLMNLKTESQKANIRNLIMEAERKPYAIKNYFKEIMWQKGMKAVDLHRETDISESNLSQVLNNKNLNMSLDTFLRIWLALDCPPIGECLYRENI